MNFPHYYSPSGRQTRQMLLAGIVLSFLFIGACGKKGPLYLPDDASASGKTGGPVTMPAPAKPSK
jgi:predicted small lipoprotein YifL